MINNFTARHYITARIGYHYTAFSATEAELGCYSTRRAALKRVIEYFKEADEHELEENFR